MAAVVEAVGGKNVAACGRMGRVTVFVAVGSSRRRRKKPVFAGRESVRAVPTKPSGTVVGDVKAESVEMESTR